MKGIVQERKLHIKMPKPELVLDDELDSDYY